MIIPLLKKLEGVITKTIIQSRTIKFFENCPRKDSNSIYPLIREAKVGESLQKIFGTILEKSFISEVWHQNRLFSNQIKLHIFGLRFRCTKI